MQEMCAKRQTTNMSFSLLPHLDSVRSPHQISKRCQPIRISLVKDDSIDLTSTHPRSTIMTDYSPPISPQSSLPFILRAKPARVHAANVCDFTAIDFHLPRNLNGYLLCLDLDNVLIYDIVPREGPVDVRPVRAAQTSAYIQDWLDRGAHIVLITGNTFMCEATNHHRQLRLHIIRQSLGVDFARLCPFATDLIFTSTQDESYASLDVALNDSMHSDVITSNQSHMRYHAAYRTLICKDTFFRPGGKATIIKDLLVNMPAMYRGVVLIDNRCDHVKEFIRDPDWPIEIRDVHGFHMTWSSRPS